MREAKYGSLSNTDIPMLHGLQRLSGLDFPMHPMGCSVRYVSSYFLLHLPFLTFIHLVFGILHLCYPNDPSGGSSGGLTAHIGVTYVSVSIGLNVIISCLICARIVYLGMVVHTSHPPQQEIPRYTGMISIIVEAAILYAISGIASVVSYGLESEISIIFLSIYIMCSVRPPLLASSFSWFRRS